MNEVVEYIYDRGTYNLISPNEIVPKVVELLKPKNVVDIGCGIGTFLYCFKQCGIQEVLGVDGNWVDKKSLYQHLSSHEYLEWDLGKLLKLDKQYDLVLSLEVAEHLPPQSADIFVQSLVNAGHIILFSAAIPSQGGQNHLNEQWMSYWESKFRQYGYVFHDVLRPMFWNNPNIDYWYKQNMVLVVPEGFQFTKAVTYNVLKNVVHQELFIEKTREINALIQGELKPVVYFKLFIKSLLGNNSYLKIKRFLSFNKWIGNE